MTFHNDGGEEDQRNEVIEENENDGLIQTAELENETPDPPTMKKQSRKKRPLPAWINRPYHVWRDQFQQDKCCPKKRVKQELIRSAIYVLFLNVFLAGFILFGSHIFTLELTSSNEEASLLDSILFCITTLSTIGYGNIVPVDDRGKIMCILYCVGGIPLFFMTVATNSLLVVEISHIFHKSITGKEAVQRTDLPWYTSAVLLAVHCFIGSLIFSFWIDELPFLDAFYFSFISITTIGYGDYSPTPEGPFQYAVVMIYLCTGVATMLIFFSSLQHGIMWIHYYGRKVSDSEEAEIWYNGQMMTVKTLVKLVAERFGSTPEKLREVMHDLDKILEVACQEAENDEDDDEEAEDWRLFRKTDSAASPPMPRKRTVFLSRSSEDDCQATIHSFTSTNQRSIPKDTENAILALSNIQHHLRKPSVRARSPHHHLPKITKPASDTDIETKEHITSLDLRKMAHRVHSDGRLLAHNYSV